MGLRLYEINFFMEQELQKAIDFETGEIIDEFAKESLDNLALERDEKIENIACLIKNLKAEANAYYAEKQSLDYKQKVTERRMKWLQSYLQRCMEPGEKFKTSRVSISWRKTKSVQVDCEPEDLLEEFQKVSVEANKTAIKKAIEEGHTVPGASIVEKQSMILK